MSRGARLLELQEIENELRDKIGAYKKVQRLLGEASPVRRARVAWEEAEASERDARARQQVVSLEWQGVRQHVDTEEKLLYSGDVRSPKELTNLQLEIEMLQRQREKLEEQAITLIEEVDRLAPLTAAAKEAYEQIERDARERQGDLETEEQQLKRLISDRRRTRDRLLEAIDGSDLEQYRYVQKLKNDTFAVSALREGVCSACHIEVSAAKRETVERSSRLVTCGNCGRILVIV